MDGASLTDGTHKRAFVPILFINCVDPLTFLKAILQIDGASLTDGTHKRAFFPILSLTEFKS
jgi:hypothetical protein